MHDWLGFGLIAIGLGLLAGAVVKRHRRQRMVVAEGEIRPEFAAMGEIVRPLVLCGVGFVGLKLSLFYFLFGGEAFLSPLDFAGLIFVLAAYCVYLIAATMRPAPAFQAAPQRDMRSHA